MQKKKSKSWGFILSILIRASFVGEDMFKVKWGVWQDDMQFKKMEKTDYLKSQLYREKIELLIELYQRTFGEQFIFFNVKQPFEMWFM